MPKPTLNCFNVSLGISSVSSIDYWIEKWICATPWVGMQQLSSTSLVCPTILECVNRLAQNIFNYFNQKPDWQNVGLQNWFSSTNSSIGKPSGRKCIWLFSTKYLIDNKFVYVNNGFLYKFFNWKMDLPKIYLSLHNWFHLHIPQRKKIFD